MYATFVCRPVDIFASRRVHSKNKRASIHAVCSSKNIHEHMMICFRRGHPYEYIRASRPVVPCRVPQKYPDVSSNEWL